MKVLEVLEQKGNKWVTGVKATRNMFFNYQKHDYYALVVCNDGEICYCATKNRYSNGCSDNIVENCKVVTAKEFLKEHAKKECIVIYRKGSETVALDKTTGKKAVAKCSPEDKYDFYTGAQLAFERLTKPAVTEVKRAAKEGEYIKIVAAEQVPTTNGVPEYKNGDILKVLRAQKCGQVRYAEGKGNRYERVVNQREYVVLEGYQPEEQPAPLYNGKVVCLETRSERLLTVGKVYEFVDGKLTFNDGCNNPKACRNFEEVCNTFSSKFIELVE